MCQLDKQINRRLKSIKLRIKNALISANRDSSEVKLVAVSKTFSPEYIVSAVTSGQLIFGENYPQEAFEKISKVNEILLSLDKRPNLEWHFLGKIQSNKTQSLANQFYWVHSIDRLKIAKRLSSARFDESPPLNVCIQINISSEESKGGVDLSNAMALAAEIEELPNLSLRGLMCIPSASKNKQVIKDQFDKLNNLFNDLVNKGHVLDTLSMGMSQDFELAIECGANVVRVGTGIFGKRNQ